MTVYAEGNSIYKDCPYKTTINTIYSSLNIQNSKIITNGFLRILLSSNDISNIKNKTVLISINGSNLNKTTDNEGYIILGHNWNVGEYLISLSYNTYTLLESQYKEVINRDSYCLYLNNAFSKYTFFKTNESNIYHIVKREKWNIIEKAINTIVVKSYSKNIWPKEITVCIKGAGYSYSEVRDEQNTGYTCGPTSASTCTQVLRNYYNETYLAKLAEPLLL